MRSYFIVGHIKAELTKDLRSNEDDSWRNGENRRAISRRASIVKTHTRIENMGTPCPAQNRKNCLKWKQIFKIYQSNHVSGSEDEKVGIHWMNAVLLLSRAWLLFRLRSASTSEMVVMTKIVSGCVTWSVNFFILCRLCLIIICFYFFLFLVEVRRRPRSHSSGE